MTLERHSGHIIGTQALLPTPLFCHEQGVVSAKREMTLVKKEFRGWDIFKRLNDGWFEIATKRGVALVLSFTTDIAAKTSVKCQYQVLGRLKSLVLILDPSQTYRISKGRIPAGVKRCLLYQVGQKFLVAKEVWFSTSSYREHHRA